MGDLDRAATALQRTLGAVLLLRQILIDETRWFLGWGVVALAARFLGVPARVCAWSGVALSFAVLIASLIRTLHARPDRSAMLALLDARMHGGGLIAASATLPLGAWRFPLIGADAPHVRWNARPKILLFTGTALFVAGALVVPIHSQGSQHRLMVGDDVKRLETRIDQLTEEKLMSPERATALKQTLEQLQTSAAGDDPAKAWETLDTIDETTMRIAADAGEHAIRGAEALSGVEAGASALQSADLGGSQLSDAMRELATEVARASAENQELSEGLSPQVRAGAGTLTRKDLEGIAAAARAGKSALRSKLAKLGRGGLLDPKALRRFDEASVPANRDDLARFLREHRTSSLGEALASCGGRGGVDRGRGDAALFFGEQVKEADEKFKDHVLPPAAAAALADSDVTGLSAAAPGGSRPEVSSGGGVTTRAGAASAFTAVVMPRHRGTVARFFERKPQ
jgi:hypothetical protein